MVRSNTDFEASSVHSPLTVPCLSEVQACWRLRPWAAGRLSPITCRTGLTDLSTARPSYRSGLVLPRATAHSRPGRRWSRPVRPLGKRSEQSWPASAAVARSTSARFSDGQSLRARSAVRSIAADFLPLLSIQQTEGIQALAAATAITDDGAHARALASLAPQLPAELLAQALTQPPPSPTTAPAPTYWPAWPPSCPPGSCPRH